jgi:hypothetical protein
MNWEKTLWNLEIVAGETTASGMAEAEIVIPEDQEGALRFLCCQARVEDAWAQTGQGQVEVEGTVAFTVLYETASGVQSLSSRNSFEHEVALQKAAEGQRCQLKVTPLSTQVRWINERQCRVECVLEMQVTCYLRQEVAPVSGIQSPGVQTAMEPIEGAWVTGSSRQVMTLREDVELDASLKPAVNVLWWQGRVNLDNVSCQAGQVDMAGEVELQVLYSTDDDKLMEKTSIALPVSRQWAAQELSPCQWLMGDGKVQQCTFKVYDNIQGEKRVLAVEAQVVLTAQGYAHQQAVALTDAYSVTDEIILETQQLYLPGPPMELQVQLPVQGDMKLAEGMTLPERVLQVLATPVVDAISVEQDEAVITGRIQASVLHASGEEAVLGSINGAAPFETVVPAQGLSPQDWLQVEIQGTQASATVTAQGGLQIREVLDVELIWRPVSSVTLATGGESKPWTEPLLPGLLLVVAQPGEGNWQMAKRCRIPLSGLVAANPQLADRQVRSGECLVVEQA